MAITLQRVATPFVFGYRVGRGVFGDGGSNGALSGWIKSKMAAGGHLGRLQMAKSLKHIIRFTVYVCTQTILSVLCPQTLIYNDGDSKLTGISQGRVSSRPTM